jgi:hypothetical protein
MSAYAIPPGGTTTRFLASTLLLGARRSIEDAFELMLDRHECATQV